MVIFAYMLFFADRAEGRGTQAMLMGSVVSVIVAMLLLLAFLDKPFRPGVGGLDPVAMERSVLLVDEAFAARGERVTAPCDAEGKAR